MRGKQEIYESKKKEGLEKKKNERRVENKNLREVKGEMSEMEAKKESLLVSWSEIREMEEREGEVLCLLMLPKVCLAMDIAPDLPPEIVSVLQDYEDVFPEELPGGLPPRRGIEHQMDLIPGAPLPNRPAYRANPEETKEIQRQVEELFQKG